MMHVTHSEQHILPPGERLALNDADRVRIKKKIRAHALMFGFYSAFPWLFGAWLAAATGDNFLLLFPVVLIVYFAVIASWTILPLRRALKKGYKIKRDAIYRGMGNAEMSAGDHYMFISPNGAENNVSASTSEERTFLRKTMNAMRLMPGDKITYTQTKSKMTNIVLDLEGR